MDKKKARSLDIITIEKLKEEMANETVDESDYAGFFKGIMLNISEVYFPKVSDKFRAAVEAWAWELGRQRWAYTPNDPLSADSEEYCYWLWMEMDGSQTTEAIRKLGADPIHKIITPQAPIGWVGLGDPERDALRYATLHICMMRPSGGGFGNEERWKGITATGAMPPLLTKSWETEQKTYVGRSEVFLQDARRLARDYREERDRSLKTNPRDPFGELAKQKKEPSAPKTKPVEEKKEPSPPKTKPVEQKKEPLAPKTKPVEQTIAKGKETVSQALPYLSDDRPATEILKNQEPKSVSTVREFPTKASSDVLKGPAKK